MKTQIIIALIFAGILGAQNSAQAQTPVWMSQKYRASVQYMMRNISPQGTQRGVVIASPSRQNPDYYFHWVRDAALVMNSLLGIYQIDSSGMHQGRWEKLFIDYAVRERTHQKVKTMTGLGEPKFNVDGTAFDGPWGRPQFDGPALRAAVLSRLAALWLQQGRSDLVRRYLWDPNRPSESLIKTDLDFLLKVWNVSSFDIWEESKGIHFFTMMAQRKAFRVGAMLAASLGQSQDAAIYRNMYRQLSTYMERFWSPTLGLFVPTIMRTGGVDYKHSGIDSSIFIAVNFAEIQESSVGHLDDSRLLNTFFLQNSVFRMYPINVASEIPMIGRYPEDKYDGVGHTGGNPWFLTTHAYGEYLYNLATVIVRRGAIQVDSLSVDFYVSMGLKFQKYEIIKKKDKRFEEILSEIMRQADGYLTRAQQFSSTQFQMAEQVNRNTGMQQGASNLTWSYSSYVTAYFARNRGLMMLKP